MKTRIILTLSCIVIISNVFGQMFSSDSVKFYKEVSSYLNSISKVKSKDFLKEFEESWYGGNFTQSQRNEVYATSNFIIEKKLKPFPDFSNYLDAIMNYKLSGKSDKEFEKWHETLNKVLEGRNKKKMQSYIKTSKELFANNTIYSSSSTVWRASNNKYHFVYDKDPYIVFDEIDLKCFSKRDSSVLYKTKGTFYPVTSKWIGVGGKLTWERAGLNKDTVYAILTDYEIGMKSAGFTVDTVDFYSQYFDKPLKGKLYEKVLANRGADKVAYPKFESYSKRLLIENIFPNINYDGGFSLTGQNLQGTGTIDNLARVIFFKDGKEFCKSESINFVINSRDISSEKASVSFYIEKDSITHPGLEFKYTNKDQKLTLIRGGEGLALSPFYNSYHKLEMFFEALYWKVGDPIMNFGILFGSSDSSASFHSYDYFDLNTYERLTGGGVNPLIKIKAYAKKMASKELELAGLATSLGKTKQYAEIDLYNLTTKGFLTYDKEREKVYIKDKLFHYIDARRKKADYDAIVISSKDKINAVLNLTSKDLKINGVKKFTLSQAQQVKAYPRDKSVVIKKNRDMEFNGALLAGRTEYFGNIYKFYYNDFKIDLLECDSMRLRVINRDKNGPPQVRLASTIEGVRGELLLDNPNNKSGKDTAITDFPKINCTKKTYVFYDKKTIQKGAYNRDEFKFILEPFSMDSLDNFTEKGVGFEGEFLSAGIFPKFEETLKVQSDYSLGFIRQTPKDGYGIYGDKANYDNEIRLSNKGLQGSGEIDFLTSNAKSDEITFLPDSLTAIAQTYNNKQQASNPETPLVKGTDCGITYIPKEKVLYAYSINKDLEFLQDGEAKLEGGLALRPEGMTGNGYMYFGNGVMFSYNYKYKQRIIDADTSAFRIRSELEGEMAIKTENVSGHVDFDKRRAEFSSNSGNSNIEFPETQYLCYMDKFVWLMDEDGIELEKKKKQNISIDSDLDLTESNFYSTNPKQDSLNFASSKARYDIKKKKLVCSNVDYITVADARIFPDSGEVVIRKKAKMDKLEKAKILANYVTKYHNISDATVEIFALKDYKASGYYDYIDINKEVQKIYMEKIKPDTTFQTTGKGKISDKVKFFMSPHFEFNGEVEMFASLKPLNFKGETRINHKCGVDKNWMSFEAPIDPDNVMIPIAEEMTDNNGNSIGAGLVMNNDSIGIYSTFLSNKIKKTHKDVITASGFLRYDKEAKEYQISNKEKFKERTLPGNFISLNTDNCEMKGSGKFDFGVNLSQFKNNSVGNINYNPTTKKIEIKSSIILNFPFNNDALEKMAKHIVEYPDVEAVDLNTAMYEQSLRETIGLEKSDKVISDLSIHGKIKKMPDELNVTMYLANVDLQWNASENAYVSKGKISLANLNKKQVFKQMNGKVVVNKRKTGDEMSIYLQLDENNFYYFNYKRGLMQAFSTNTDFNSIIEETKKDKTKFKGKKDEEDYQYMLSTKTKAIGFRRKFE